MPVKNYIRNVILVMSGGIGARFGTDCPKQYNYMDGKPVIDYVIEASRRSACVDEIVIVASGDYLDYCRERFNVPVVKGGSTRPESVANGLKYIHENYDCDKLIITNAVCPLASSEQYDKYFRLLDDYDFVLTTWKLAPALHRFDGVRVDRDEFFNVMEPDAYKFRLLYSSFDFENLHKYIFHNMPEDSKGYFCFDYPYTMKLTYSYDLKLLKILYDEFIYIPDKDKTLQTVNGYLSADGTPGIDKWIQNVQMIMAEMAHKYSVNSYAINSQTEANIVYEAHSHKYGDIIFKFTPSSFHFHKEYAYYDSYRECGFMAELIDRDEEYNLLILKMIKPGIQVKFNTDNAELRRFFDNVNKFMLPSECLKGDKLIPDVMSEFDEYSAAAGKFTFELDFRKTAEKKAREIWKKYFEEADKYFLHRDLHKRNILTSGEHNMLAIDPRGAAGPRAFEYVIQFIIELRECTEYLDVNKYNEMIEFFSAYTDKEELLAALYIFWVYKMNDYVFQKHDNNKLAAWCKKCILEIYYGGIEEKIFNDIPPSGLERL